MTNNHQTIVGTVAGGATAIIKAWISLDGVIETIGYAIIGAVTGFLVTEALKYKKSKIKKK
jgi:uncharacterized membrane protein YeaQ/YmgE (transglycosylase-associated protein family)